MTAHGDDGHDGHALVRIDNGHAVVPVIAVAVMPCASPGRYVIAYQYVALRIDGHVLGDIVAVVIPRDRRPVIRPRPVSEHSRITDAVIGHKGIGRPSVRPVMALHYVGVIRQDIIAVV